MTTSVDPLEQEYEARDPDVRLMLQVRDDVPGAFETLVGRYQHRVLAILTHLIGRGDEAEDLSQDVFLRVYRGRKEYHPRARFSTWLFTIANHRALNHLRGRGRSRGTAVGVGHDSTGALVDRVPSREATASTQFRKAELSEVVREALEVLGEDQKMAVLLNKFEGMSYAEIAEVMGRSEPAIKSLLARARMTLKDRLEPYLSTGRRVR